MAAPAQPQGILSTSVNNPTAASSSTTADPNRKARLVGPEIVQLPDPVDAESDEETDAEDDGATELGGEPRVRNKDSLRDVPDDTEVRLTARQASLLLADITLARRTPRPRRTSTSPTRA